MLAALLASTILTAAPADGPACFPVTRYGAAGQDARTDTLAFQQAVDACAAAGGGVVTVPPGRYTIGRVTLASHVTLEIEAGAEVHASTDQTLNPAVAGSPRSAYRPENGDNALNCRYAMFYAYRASGVTIRGAGRLVGDGKSFWTVRNTGGFAAWNTVAPWFYYAATPFRPIPILLEDCEGAQVRDITIEDTPCYAGWFPGCRSLLIDSVRVRNDPAGPNTDGFHFSSCRDVHVRDCDFVCGDDCVAIDPNHDGPASGFVITGCTFRTTVNAFRIYTGLDPLWASDKPRGLVSDITASNCVVDDASGVVNITAEAGDIERVAFIGFTINQDLRGSALFLLTQGGGAIRDVLLSDMATRTDGVGCILADGGEIRGVTMSNLRYEVCPRTKLYGNEIPEPLPGYGMHHFAPYGLVVRHAREVRLRDIDIRWGEADLADLEQTPGGTPHWPAFRAMDVTGLDVQGLSCRQYGSDAPAILLTDTREATIAHSRALEGTGVFLRLAGACSRVALVDSDLGNAATVSDAGAEVPAGALTLMGNR
jgi:hypothetical protein